MKQLSEQCRVCRYVKTCQHKRIEDVAVCASASAPLMESAAMPVLAKHDYRDVKIVGMMTFDAFAQVDLWRCI